MIEIVFNHINYRLYFVFHGTPHTSTADWVLFWAFHQKGKSLSNPDIDNSTTDTSNFSSDPLDPENYLSGKQKIDLPWNEQILSFCETRFDGFFEIGIPAFLVSYIFFFGIGGFLHVSSYSNNNFILKLRLLLHIVHFIV